MKGIRNQIRLERFLSELMGKNCKMKSPHKRDQFYWVKRPIDNYGLQYAACDVLYLLEATENLLSQSSDSEIQTITQNSIVNLKIPKSKSNLVELNAETVIKSEKREKNEIPFKVSKIEDFQEILRVLPKRITEILLKYYSDEFTNFTDIVVDLNRNFRIHRNSCSTIFLDEVVSQEDLEFIRQKCGRITDSNRACLGETLHRCSFIFDGEIIVGVTIRAAKIISGLSSTFRESLLKNQSILLVGPPGCGKTTLLRDISRYLASPGFDKRVMIVDTNNEIGGENVIPHIAVGNARRMKVGNRNRQHHVMLEAVQNHTPEVLGD